MSLQEMYVWAKLLDVLLIIATLPNSLINYVSGYPKFQKGLRNAGNIIEGDCTVLAVKRSSEQEVTSVVCINCLLDYSVWNEIWRAEIASKGKTINSTLPEQEMIRQRLILSLL